MRVRFSDEALAKLHAIHSYIAVDAPMRATPVIERIIRRAEQVGDLPYKGRKVPEFQREWLREVRERPYRIIYRIKPREIEIVTVMHDRQLLPQDLK